MKGRRIIIPAVLQGNALKQLQLDHMGIEKTRLLPHETIYWDNMNPDIGYIAKNCPLFWDFQATQPKVDKMLIYNSRVAMQICKS